MCNYHVVEHGKLLYADRFERFLGMRVAILHDTLNTAGGAERVCLGVAKTLHERLDAQVTLYTADKPDWSLIREKLGPDWVPSNGNFDAKYFLPSRLPLFGIYQRMLVSILANRTIPKQGFDMVVNTFGDAIGLPADYTYVYFAMSLLGGNGALPSKYTSNWFWRFYFEPYRKYIEKHAPKIIRTTFPLYTSLFSKMFCEKTWGVSHGMVLYPPVDEGLFARYKNKAYEERDRSVIVISRLVPEKGLEMIPELAKRLQDIGFHIVGGTNQYSMHITRLLDRSSKELNNLFIHKNAPIDELTSIAGNSRVLLHTMENEHFGIAPIEGMHAGLPLVVHASGGPLLDITDHGKYGLCFKDLDYAYNHISKLVDDRKTWNYYHEKSIERCQKFTMGAFMDGLEDVIRERSTEYKRVGKSQAPHLSL